VGDACNGAVTHPGARAETHVYADIWTRSPPAGRSTRSERSVRPAAKRGRRAVARPKAPAYITRRDSVPGQNISQRPPRGSLRRRVGRAGSPQER
jgi:hypothetical protein